MFDRHSIKFEGIFVDFLKKFLFRYVISNPLTIRFTLFIDSNDNRTRSTLLSVRRVYRWRANACTISISKETLIFKSRLQNGYDTIIVSSNGCSLCNSCLFVIIIILFFFYKHTIRRVSLGTFDTTKIQMKIYPLSNTGDDKKSMSKPW